MKQFIFSVLFLAMAMSAAMAQLAPEDRYGRHGSHGLERELYYTKYLIARQECERYLDERHEYENCLRRHGF